MANSNAQESARYGTLALVAINFHVQTGTLSELDAAVVYAKAALAFARKAEIDDEIATATAHAAQDATRALCTLCGLALQGGR